MRFTFDACARLSQTVLLAAVLAVVPSHVTLAHEGHSHDDPKATGAAESASPRVVATSETYQLVGIVEGEVLVIYLDRAADNAPITTARIELTLDGGPVKVEPNQRD